MGITLLLALVFGVGVLAVDSSTEQQKDSNEKTDYDRINEVIKKRIEEEQKEETDTMNYFEKMDKEFADFRKDINKAKESINKKLDKIGELATEVKGLKSSVSELKDDIIDLSAAVRGTYDD